MVSRPSAFNLANGFSPVLGSFDSRANSADSSDALPFLLQPPPTGGEFPGDARGINIAGNPQLQLRSAINTQKNTESKALQEVAKKEGEKADKDLQAAAKKLSGPGGGGAA